MVVLDNHLCGGGGRRDGQSGCAQAYWGRSVCADERYSGFGFMQEVEIQRLPGRHTELIDGGWPHLAPNEANKLG